MFPFWEPVIAPLVAASNARRIVEIGALRGETTARMLRSLGPEAELHVIDPLPQFDPAVHEAEFPGRYIFHRDLSLNVLDTAPAFDVALIDGDHNWYTVYHELQALRTASQRADRPLPLLILHDVGWPYGRRDLYYEPSQIPEEFRQPYARRGMRPGRAELLGRGGMNTTLDNALVEGGPRNGVRTALDDFLDEHTRPVRTVVIPIYFGLAIVAEEAFLEAHPAVADLLDRIDSHDGTREMLDLSESIRLDATVFEHNVGRVQQERMTRSHDRYLKLLRDALLDLHYLENEDRITYLRGLVESGQPLDVDSLRSPANARPPHMRALHQARDIGEADPDTPGPFAYAGMGRQRLDELHEALTLVHDSSVPGDLVEIGCGRGGGAIYMRGFLQAHEVDDRDVVVIDPFCSTGLAAGLNEVRDGFDRFDLLDERTRFVVGRLPDAAAAVDTDTIALLRIGATVGDPADVLTHVHGRMAPGGVVILEHVDDHRRDAITALLATWGVSGTDQVGWSGMAWVVPSGVATPDPVSTSVSRAMAPPAPAAATATLDLSVVVVFYNMAREAARTLHTLSRSYQRGIDDLAYEVIVVDNGSDHDQRLTAAYVEGFGPEFRLIDAEDPPSSSPTRALNAGIAASTGAAVALMIDGAHMLSPGVFANALRGLEAYSPAIVATQHWYVGPGQQPDAVAAGYDQESEDALFDEVDWPADGYRLFDISSFIGERDWFDGILESNCLFVPRELLRQVGGFDDSFSTSGGGYANLELLERLGGHPDVDVVTMLGEASFHQVHGGTTTNAADIDARREATLSYATQYEELRGRALRGPARVIQYIGGFRTDAARRTRSRRLTAPAFLRARGRDTTDGPPTTPALIPDELANAFTEAYWQSLAWQESTWMGRPLGLPPTDLVAYQQIIADVRPDVVVVTTRHNSAVAEFAAAMCQLLDHGRVIAVDQAERNLPERPRLDRVTGLPYEADTIAAVQAAAGESVNGLVILGYPAGVQFVQRQFDAYAPLVAIGSYVIVENTVVNGHPVWPGYGPGPNEAVRRVLANRDDFVQDTAVHRFGLTFNPGGYLRRRS